jgi:hypothetical protein
VATVLIIGASRGVGLETVKAALEAGHEIILKPTRFFSKATRVLVTAMEETQVRRLICVTGFGAGDSRGHGGFLYSVLRELGEAMRQRASIRKYH